MDVTDPALPLPVAFVDMPTIEVVWAWGAYAIVADEEEGFVVVGPDCQD